MNSLLPNSSKLHSLMGLYHPKYFIDPQCLTRLVRSCTEHLIMFPGSITATLRQKVNRAQNCIHSECQSLEMIATLGSGQNLRVGGVGSIRRGAKILVHGNGGGAKF